MKVHRGHGLLVLVAVATVAGATVAGGCQPWYRDNERRGRLALDEDRTTHELTAAHRASAAGQHARAAAILRGTIDRDPMAPTQVWLALAKAESAAGQVRQARVHARWKLQKVATSDAGAPQLRAFLIESLAAEGLIAQALDLVAPASLQAALAYPTLAARLRELADAVTKLQSPELMLLHLSAWLATYGEPDHAILRETRAQLATALWAAAAQPTAVPALAALRQGPGFVRDELAHGNVAAALMLFVGVRQLAPDAVVAQLLPAVEQAASTARISALSSEIQAQAVAADAALRRGELAVAIAGYRRVVAAAPWWVVARRNLAALVLTDQP